MEQLQRNSFLILYDGECGVCDFFVEFTLRNDTSNKFQFCSLQSNMGKKIVAQFKLDYLYLDSVILIKNEKCFLYSEAVFKILSEIGFPYRFLLVFSLLPLSINNFFYVWFAKNRYKFFKKKTVCRLLTKEEIKKFIS